MAKRSSATRKSQCIQGRFLTGIPLPGEPKIWKKGKLYCREEDEDGFQLLVRYLLKWKL